LAGFKAHVIDRINYMVKQQYKMTRNMEFNWFSNPSVNDSSIFTHVLVRKKQT